MAYRLSDATLKMMAERTEERRDEYACNLAAMIQAELSHAAARLGFSSEMFRNRLQLIEAMVDKTFPQLTEPLQVASQPVPASQLASQSPVEVPVFSENDAPAIYQQTFGERLGFAPKTGFGQEVFDDFKGRMFDQPGETRRNLTGYIVDQQTGKPDVTGGVPHAELDLNQSRFYVALYTGDGVTPALLEVLKIETMHGYDPDSRVATRVVVVNQPDWLIHEGYMRDTLNRIERGIGVPGDSFDVIDQIRRENGWLTESEMKDKMNDGGQVVEKDPLLDAETERIQLQPTSIQDDIDYQHGRQEA